MTNEAASEQSHTTASAISWGSPTRPIGSVAMSGIRMATAHAHVAELGYELHPDYWGHGYATEAARSMLAFGFGTLRLQRVWAQCVAENTASARVLERLGMSQQRRLRQHTVMQNRWWDMLVYAIDRAAWQEQEG